MPLGQNLGGNKKKKKNNRNNSKDRNCLTSKQADYVYRKVELGSSINKNIMKGEMDPDLELNKIDNNSGDENPYREPIVNNAGKVEYMLSN